jgi:hypothetical protein
MNLTTEKRLQALEEAANKKAWAAWEAAHVRAEALYPLPEPIDMAIAEPIDTALKVRYPALFAGYFTIVLEPTEQRWSEYERLEKTNLTRDQIRAKIPPPRFSKKDLKTLQGFGAICGAVLELPELTEVERGYMRGCYSLVCFLLETARF